MISMDLYVKLVPKNKQFSRAFNRVPVKEVYYHHDLLKKFNPEQLLNEPLPAVHIPTITEREELNKVIKNAMALMVREIDPATFLQVDSMRHYYLERGLIVAVYSMIAEHQLPLETYFGFTFGLHNPDGIKSGAFWFYHKYGFRPVDAELNLLAENEYKKIKTRKNYRSTEKTLLRFTEDNIAFSIQGKIPLNVQDVLTKILTVISKSWQNDYHEAREQAVNRFCKKVNINKNKLTGIQKNVLEDIALWAFGNKIKIQTNKIIVLQHS